MIFAASSCDEGAGILLHHSPVACSRVVINALAEIGADFEICIVNIMSGAQKKPDYLAINPRGKAPALSIGGEQRRRA